MYSTDEALFWKKKEYISFLLSILVFFIHSYFGQNIVGESFISIFNHKVSYFFSCSMTRFAVPMFFMMSGISFFKDYSNKKYVRKIKSRFFTLVIPYLLWNTIWMLWEIFTSHSFVAQFSENNVPYPLTFISILKGILFYNCNPPFWFIFDLILFSVAAPLVFFIIRHRYVGIISAVSLSIISLFGIHLPMDLFYYPMSIVFYIIGAIIGYHYFDYVAKKSSKPIQIASAIFIIAYLLAKNIARQEIHIDNYLTQTIVYTLAAFSLWNIVDSFVERIKPRTLYRRSFAIYAMHLPVAIVIQKILTFCLPKNEFLEFPKFIIMIILTLTMINLVCSFLEKFTPKIYSILMGNRKTNVPTKTKGITHKT